MKNYTLPFLLFISGFVTGQESEKSIFNNVKFENVGPTIMSGRVVDVDVNPDDPTEFYVGYASGGVWHTKNNGTTFNSIMDNALTQNVGDIAVNWKNKVIWVGTGEVNSSRSSYAGIGILKTSDNGKSWQNMGLKDSHHISRIVLNPANPDEIIVGSLGHLYTNNDERGIFKSRDGGKTWSKNLFIDNETGIIDVVAAPNNFNIQYAASWKKNRKAWDFLGNGATSGLYKSEDAGTTWKLISNEAGGFANGEGVGRIGLAIFDENTVYAVLDNQFKRPATSKETLGLPQSFAIPGDEFLKIPNKELNAVLKTYGITEKYRAENIKHWIKNDYLNPEQAWKILQKSNLEEKEVIGAEVYKTIDGGKKWTKTNKNFINDLFYSYGYYFSSITVDLKDANKIYLSGVPLIKSTDGGSTFASISKDNVHSDHHIVWVNPKKAGHIINGNDGGINISYDDGENWIKCNSNNVSQFYAINVDYQTPYNIYGGMQDNGVWVGSSNYENSPEWHQTGEYPYKSIMGGDGMQTQIDSRNPNIVFTGFQFGNYYRIDRQKNKQEYIAPQSKKGENPLRFNWQTPILLSSHNQDILYFGSNFLHRSMNQGTSWTTISPDLTFGEKKGNVAFGTLTTISESLLSFGLLYTGSDDGKINISKDGGISWNLISDNLPKNLWISRIVASSHKKERVYATLNGYRNDDFTAYVFVSDDYGMTWKNISGNLSENSVNVIIEDDKNENILYLGTDNGLYISINKGTTWQDFSSEIPNVAVHDLVIQKTTKELLVATHGRSIYRANIENIQKLNDTILSEEIHIFEIKPITKSNNWGRSWNSWRKPVEPAVLVWIYSNSDGNIDIAIENDNKQNIFTQKFNVIKGLNKIEIPAILQKEFAQKWNSNNKKSVIEKAQNDNYYFPAATYKLKIRKNDIEAAKAFDIISSKKSEPK